MEYFALEVRNERTWNLVQAILPSLRSIAYEDAKLHFLVFDSETGEHALYGPGAVANTFDRIENSHTIMVKKMIGK